MRRFRYCIGVLLAALWIAPLGAQVPSGTIRGRVTDATSQRPLQGATITFGNHNAVTQADGRYYLTGVPAGTDSLRARMIGYAGFARTVTVVGGQTIDVDLVMTAQAVNLAEIVVVGYGEQQLGNITGAVTSVSAEEFNTGRVVSPTELIQNKVAGVQVVENNEPGGGLSIRIRGTTSINASSEPLYRHRRHAGGKRRGRRALGRAGSAELPEPRRHREHHGAAGRVGGGHLRGQRGQRRGADHDQAWAAESRSSSTPAAFSRPRALPACPPC